MLKTKKLRKILIAAVLMLALTLGAAMFFTAGRARAAAHGDTGRQ